MTNSVSYPDKEVRIERYKEAHKVERYYLTLNANKKIKRKVYF